MEVKFKTVFIILLFFIALNSTNAQISIGIQGGLNSAILKLSNKAPIATRFLEQFNFERGSYLERFIFCNPLILTLSGAPENNV